MWPAVLIATLLLPSVVAAQPRRIDVPHAEQAIGSWLLACAVDPMTDAQICRMRHKLWLVVPNDSHPGMALEVQLRADQLVPVVTVRDLTLSTAFSGLLALTATAQLRFDAAPMAELPCTLEEASVVCAPSKADSAPLADQLARARTVLVRFRAPGNLPLPVPDVPLALDLEDTQAALTRYRLTGPEVAPAPSTLTQDLRNSAERLLRRLGVPGLEGQAEPRK